jgi:Icc-related predicted phosphoesterase
MKIALVSDVHLEFGDLEFANDSGADVLILGGDICVGSDMVQRDPYNTMGEEYRSNRFHNFFQQCCDRFPHVIFIVGNHEHYHGDFTKTVPHFKDVLGYLPNLHILEKETVVLDDVTFIGGTLWTDMNRRDIRTLHEISRMMNDFRCVDHSAKLADQRGWGGRFTTTDAADDHDAMVEYIKTTVEANPAGRYVVVGHHSPLGTPTTLTLMSSPSPNDPPAAAQQADANAEKSASGDRTVPVFAERYQKIMRMTMKTDGNAHG